ncbi:Type III helper protein HrpK1 [Pseudomonas cichorii]|uniref:Type III helper protein HrpK1 n=1 Tax=Pseudomonas cichorii TaxID=36746 RepID=A0A3M4LYZ0_PSECI|nr:type III effector HrpK domain-containing protein [Pseudomonas cichorii]RMQ46699.1 Type III helper protein HrpK1 [Pseudomonas cichorii]
MSDPISSSGRIGGFPLPENLTEVPFNLSPAELHKPAGGLSGIDYGQAGMTRTAAQPTQVAEDSILQRLFRALTSQLAGKAQPPVRENHEYLDDSKYSSPEELAKWDGLLGDMPASRREQAAKELNRPIAAARMIAANDPDADKAWAFLDENPTLKTAMDTAQGGKADGKITRKDAKTFAKNMEKQVDRGTDSLNDFRKDNPDADAQSVQLVRSAAVLLAHEPITEAGDPSNAQGVEGQTKVNGRTTIAGLESVSTKNPGLSDVLQDSAATWAQPGMFEMMDQGNMRGKKLAMRAPDGVMVKKDISTWIRHKAPANEEDFSRVISDAATVGAVSNVDISKLNGDVFSNPQGYSGEQKAAVLVELQQIAEQVVAGRSIRNTSTTETALNEKITQLQDDPAVQAFLGKNTDRQAELILNSDPALARAVNETTRKNVAGAPGSTGMSTAFVPGGTGKDTNQAKDDAALAASTAQRVLGFGDNVDMRRTAGKVGVGLGGRIAGAIAGRVVGAIAGQAAGAAAATAVSAAAGPVGWVVSGAMSIGLGISEIVNAVKERKERKAFSRTVNPVLEQFGIPKPK